VPLPAHFLASDVSAIVAHTREAVYLNDYEIVTITADGFDICTLAGSGASFQVSKVEFQAEDVDKGAFPHYMLKEIFEQPNSVRDALRGRLSVEEATAKLGGAPASHPRARRSTHSMHFEKMGRRRVSPQIRPFPSTTIKTA